MTIGSLFSGIGGLELGLEMAGFGPVKWQVEIDDYATAVLNKNYPDVKRYRDVHDVGKHNLESVDLICGGFPCQPFSVAGKQKGAKDDRHLWPEMARVIKELRPSLVIAENVPNISTMELDNAISDLESFGYTVLPALNIPACALEADHVRRRIFIVAYLDSIWELQPEGIDGKKRRRSRDGVTEDVAYLADERLQRGLSARENGEGVGRISDRAGPSVSAQDYVPKEYWDYIPIVGRRIHGIPHRVDRIKCLGNSVVPQVSHAVGKIIMEWLCQYHAK